MTTDTAVPIQPKRGLAGQLLRMLGLLVAALLLVGAGFGAGFFYFGKPLSPADDLMRLIDKTPAETPAAAPAPDAPARVPRPSRTDTGFETSYYTLAEPLTSNLLQSRKFLQLSITVATDYDGSVLDHVKRHEQAIRADALQVISGFTEDQLHTREGRAQLASELLGAINARLETMENFGGIKEVIFPAFVMQ